jgi:hypothetical protein
MSGSGSAGSPGGAGGPGGTGASGGGIMKNFGSIASYGFFGLDAYSRMKDGENFIPAVAKAALTNAFWAAVPGGLWTMVGYTAATMLPTIANAIDQAAAGQAQKFSMFGSKFQETEAQQMMLGDSVNKMMMNREVSMASQYSKTDPMLARGGGGSTFQQGPQSSMSNLAVSRQAMRNHKVY